MSNAFGSRAPSETRTSSPWPNATTSASAPSARPRRPRASPRSIPRPASSGRDPGRRGGDGASGRWSSRRRPADPRRWWRSPPHREPRCSRASPRPSPQNRRLASAPCLPCGDAERPRRRSCAPPRRAGRLGRPRAGPAPETTPARQPPGFWRARSWTPPPNVPGRPVPGRRGGGAGEPPCPGSPSRIRRAGWSRCRRCPRAARSPNRCRRSSSLPSSRERRRRPWPRRYRLRCRLPGGSGTGGPARSRPIHARMRGYGSPPPAAPHCAAEVPVLGRLSGRGPAGRPRGRRGRRLACPSSPASSRPRGRALGEQVCREDTRHTELRPEGAAGWLLDP